MKHIIGKLTSLAVIILFWGCKGKNASTLEMMEMLSSLQKSGSVVQNSFCPEAQLLFYDSVLKEMSDERERSVVNYYKATGFLQLGQEEKSIFILEELLQDLPIIDTAHRKLVIKDLAIAYLRLGERMNCIHNHGAQSCVFPLQGTGIHNDKTGSSRAIEAYKILLTYNPDDIESRWLLNIAYMTLGEYPQRVPARFLIPGLDKDTSKLVKPFTDVALKIGMNTKNMAGGSIIDDFNNDGYYDIVTSSWDLKEGMHYCRNNADGSFTDVSDSSGLQGLTGGLNIMQTDYNNDGLKDIFVLRGAWKGNFGNEPNSLLRNNGNGTFTDVTKESGLLSFHPTQTATWNDFNNDGWLDVFIGNESTTALDGHSCELYLNNKNGTFTNIAVQSKTNITAFVKGVSSGDFDNDGWPDIFISTLQTQKFLLKNQGIKNGQLIFSDVTREAGLSNFNTRSFPTWFWDYDNDGWLDILACGYEFGNSLSYFAAAEALNFPVGATGKQFLFRNNHDGTFEDVSEKTGLTKVAFAMGSNFGDIDNDGYLDMYLGTGNPLYQSLIPNKMFKNIDGKRFEDVTSPARVGNLQKGHGVSFADLDNDGDEDIYIEMGGAFYGDAYENSLYLNPGQNTNNWINLKLEGVICNKAAIGARIKLTFKENGVTRSVYRDVNSGGSFGSNPLTQHIGIGKADIIDRIEIIWPVSKKLQVFENIQAGQYLKIKEGQVNAEAVLLKKADFTSNLSGLISCSPQ